MKIRCLFFAASRELTGITETSFDLPTTSSSTSTSTSSSSSLTTDCFLKEILLVQFPQLRKGFEEGSWILALNLEFVEPSSQLPLKEGDEIAVIPPISGG